MGQPCRDSLRLLGLQLRDLSLGRLLALHMQHLCGACLVCMSVCIVYDVVELGPGDIQPRVALGICLGLLALSG